MASQAALDIVIQLNAGAAEKGMLSMSKSVSDLGKQSEHTHSLLSGMLTGVGFAAMNAGISAVSSGFQALTGFIGDSIQESRDAAHGLAQTEAAIKSTGGAAGVTAQQIVDLAGSLSHVTLFSDDAIQAQQNLLLTFTNVQNKAGEGNDIFTQASKIGLDMAQAMGTDAASGAVQLGKALNDPVAGITALTRVGVTFTDQQKAQIKSMAEHNNVIGAQKIVLGELTKEFGGSAAAAMQADGGFHLFQQRLADVKQTIGDALQPALHGIMGLLSGPFLDIVESFGTSLASGLGTAIPAIEGFVSKAITTFRALGGGDGVGGVIQMMIGAVGDLIPGLQPAVAWLQDHFWPAWFAGEHVIAVARDAFLTFKDALAGNWTDDSKILGIHRAFGLVGSFLHDNFMPILVGVGTVAVAAFGLWAVSAASAAAATIAALAPVVLPMVALGAAAALLYKGWETNFGGMRDAVTAAWGVISPILSDFMSTLSTLGSYFAAVVDDGDTFNDFLAAMPGWLQPIAVVGGDVVNFLMDFGSAIGSAASALAGGDFSGALTALTGWIGPLQEDLSTLGTDIVTWLVPVGQAIADQVMTWGAAFVGWVVAAIPGVLAELNSLIVTVGSWVIEQVPVLGAQLLAWGQGFVDWIGPMIPPALVALDALIVDIGGWVVAQVPVLAAQLLAWGQGFVDWVIPMIPPVLDALGALATSLFGWIGEQAGALVAAFGTWAGAVVEWIGPATAAFLQAWPGMLNSFLGWIGAQVGPILAGFGQWSIAILQWIAQQAPGFAAQLATWAVSFVGWIVPMIPGFVAALGGVAVALVTFVGQTAVVLLGKLAEWGTAFGAWVGQYVLPALPGILEGIATALWTFISTTATLAQTKLQELAQKFLGWVDTDVTPFLSGKLDAIKTTISGWVTTTATWVGGEVASIGKAIVDGVAGAITAGAGSIATAAKNAITAALDAAKALAGIKSPSTVFAAEVGVPIVEGIQLGILQTMPQLMGAMRASTNSLIQEIVGFIDSGDTTSTLNAAGATAINALIGGARQANPGQQIVAGMNESLLKSMPAVWSAMKASTDSLIQEIVSFVESGDTTSTLNAAGAAAINALLAGLKTGAAPAMREMPAWVGYVKDLGDGLRLLGPRTDWMAGAAKDAKDLGDGLRLLGDQTPAVQDLGNGLTLLGDQWARQASTMTDLAPKLPQLADGYAGVADAAKTAAAATTRATDDMLDHIKLLGGASLDGKAGFGGDSGGGPLSYLNDAGGLGGTAQYAKQAGTDAGMGFGDGWKAGIEQIGPVFQDTTRMALLQLHDVVLLPWQTQTNDFFSGAGFGFIGQASIGINSAGNGLATSAGNVGGAAGAALVSSMRGNLGGVSQFVSDVNTTLSHIEREITIHVKTVYDG